MSAAKGVAQHRPPKPRNLGWIDLAACVGHDPRKFEEPHRFREALEVCKECPVQAPCRELGKGMEGVWGGRPYYADRRRR